MRCGRYERAGAAPVCPHPGLRRQAGCGSGSGAAGSEASRPTSCPAGVRRWPRRRRGAASSTACSGGCRSWSRGRGGTSRRTSSRTPRRIPPPMAWGASGATPPRPSRRPYCGAPRSPGCSPGSIASQLPARAESRSTADRLQSTAFANEQACTLHSGVPASQACNLFRPNFAACECCSLAQDMHERMCPRCPAGCSSRGRPGRWRRARCWRRASRPTPCSPCPSRPSSATSPRRCPCPRRRIDVSLDPFSSPSRGCCGQNLDLNVEALSIQAVCVNSDKEMILL